ncbi:MAG TPA: PAS domain-containing protein [Opitutaceae bacterium]|nr:PAS domain-containing protein [Opitutaceae bacterium]
MQSLLAEVNKTFVTSRPIRVLIVEDREEDFLYFSFLLQRNAASTYVVEWASNYQAALAAVNRREHDVALFDYQLGARTGLDLLRETVAGLSDMPVILLTGHDSPEIDREALEGGAADYLCKVGLSATQLERSIRYSLRQSAMLSVLRKSQQQLDLFMRSVPCAISIQGEGGEFLFKNQRFQNEFDSSAVAMPKNPQEIEDSRPYFDGSRHWLVNSFPMIDAHGRALRGTAAIDITDRVNAEEALRRTTGVLTGILASLPVMATRLAADGKVLECRGRGLAEVGFTEDQIVGSHISDFYPQHAEQIRAALAGGEVNFVGSIVHHGRTHYYDNYFRFDQQKGEGAIGFSVNITARVEAEMARNRHSQLLTGILANLPIVVGRLDAMGRVIEADGDSLTASGIKPSALLGQKLAELFPQSEEAIAKALGGESVTLSLSGNYEDDDEWHAEFFVSFDAQNKSGAIFLGRDVTERKWLERRILSISDAEQQRIGADLHDGLGQHLTGIACMTTALRDRLQSANPNEAKSAAMIAGLVNDAIAQCRALSRGLCPVQLEHTGLPSALEDLTFQVQLISGVNCRFKAVGTPPVCSHDAAMHVYRITQEAINNAIRHGEAKSVNVSLVTNGTTCKVMIEDDGTGFDVDAERKAPGVGLRLMNYRAAIIGGTFAIAARPGGGVAIECTFPKDLTTHENSK